MKNKKTILAVALTTSMLASGVNAAITYVDADLATNTTLADGTAMNLVATVGDLTNPQDYYAPGDATISPQFHWGDRTRASDVNGLTVIVAAEDAQNGGAVTDAPVLRTTAAVANGSYEVYAYFRHESWIGQAGLTEGSVGAGATVLAAAADFDDATGLVFGGAGTTSLHAMFLGTATVTDGNLNVFIDDNGAGSVARTWYEGIGYEFIAPIPEPSSTALLGLGGLALIFRRRK